MRETNLSTNQLPTRWIVYTFAALASVLLMLALIATAPTGTARAGVNRADPPPPLSIAELEQSVALELSNARLNPTAMADDLAAATHDGWYAAIMPNGVPFATLADFQTASEKEARSQPVLTGLRWSETLATAARDWAPYYGSSGPYSSFSLAHGCAKPGLCFAQRIERARGRVDGKLGGAIEAIATQRMYGKSFVYTWWVSSSEWKIGSPTNPLAPDGGLNRGHRGIIGDVRMTAVGVGCAVERRRTVQGKDPSPPDASCVAILGSEVADAAPNILGAPTDTSLDQLDGTTGSLGSTTGEGGSTLVVDPFAPPTGPTNGLDTGEPATGGQAIDVDEAGNETAIGSSPDTGDTTTPPDGDTTTPPDGDTTTPPDGGATTAGVAAATFEAACEGFGAYLRQEIASKEATRSSGPGCSFVSPDLQEAVLEIAPRSQFPESDVACEDVAQGRAEVPLSAAAKHLQSLSTDGTLSAVTSSGSTEKSFPFLVSSETVNGLSVASSALSCDDEFVYQARLRRDEGVNPLLTVNAAAEAVRRSDDAPATSAEGDLPRPAWTPDRQYALLDFDSKTFEFVLAVGSKPAAAGQFTSGTWTEYSWYPCPEGPPTEMLQSPNRFYHSDDTEDKSFKDQKFLAGTIGDAMAAGFTAANQACDVKTYPHAEK